MHYTYISTWIRHQDKYPFPIPCNISFAETDGKLTSIAWLSFDRWYVTIWDWESRLGCPTFGTAKQATRSWTWRKNTKAFSGKKKSSHFSKRLPFPRTAQPSNSATLNCRSRSRKSSGKWTNTSSSYLMPWSHGLKLGMSLTRQPRVLLNLQTVLPKENFEYWWLRYFLTVMRINSL